MSKQYKTTITRPDDTISYSVGDVVGEFMTFPDINILAVGELLRLLTAQVLIYRTDIPTGMTTFALHFYSSAPPSNIADNSAWDLTVADRPYYLGSVQSSAVVDRGATLEVQFSDANLDLALTSTSMFAYLSTDAAFTPEALTVQKVSVNMLGL